ncbi:DJ-1/PfpI family protein [Cohnella hashimotonis]|uniref:DJ-1/PfpI family protein n=1 Tax=Cohnella hashimotonis TaxID=2826895 RepID=A0ABT6TMD5_9BACL|nr:DJ-1/PfpI family protein [Cohnella hashimotonis]MDI4647731.1 DJ-1/PfpI family protein [Cohnella hashimotonis]
MLDVQVVLFDGFDLMDAIAAYEVFLAAEMYAPGTLNVKLVTAEGARAVPSGISGLKIEASGKLDPERPGIILVPGASGDVTGDGPDSVPAILNRAMNTALTDMMREALGKKDVVVAAVCGGSLILAMGGLLEGRHAVTNHMGMALLGATGAIAIPARVVDDGDLVTGGGVTSGLDVALHLVERELGPQIALAVERLFEYEKRGTVWRALGNAPRTNAISQPDKDSDKVLNDERRDVAPTDTAAGASASAFAGEWAITIATPVGKMAVKLLILAANGKLEGTATQGDEKSELLNLALEGHILRWSQRITKPMRLNLAFEVSVSGDRMTGIVRAGFLPASRLSGTRTASY